MDFLPPNCIAAIMLLLGLSVHLLKELVRISMEQKSPANPVKYFTDYPYQTLICLIGAVAGYFALHETGQLSGLTAFGVGYMANSVADMLGKRGAPKLEGA